MPAEQVSIASGTTFLVSDSAGNITSPGTSGLFIRDTRHLSEYLLRIDGETVVPLQSAVTGPGQSQHYAMLANLKDIPAQSLVVHRVRTLGAQFVDQITVTNYADDRVALTLSLEVDADFADMFEVRGLTQRVPARAGVEVEQHQVAFKDTRYPEQRRTIVDRDPSPDYIGPNRSKYEISLIAGQSWSTTVTVTCVSPRLAEALPSPVEHSDNHNSTASGYLGHPADIDTDDPALERAYLQAVGDLRMLEIPLDSGQSIPAAGLPWYLTIFGRDSLITSLQTLFLDTEIARGTLLTLAAYQSNEENAFRDAEPGKFPHEIRFGELALSSEIPHGRYYGSVDATPLWVILLNEYAKWSSDFDFVQSLLSHAEAAISWIDESGDLDGDGFIEYSRRSSHGLINQGWKDSEDSIRFADGSAAEGPVALVEVQGYACAAKFALAELYDLFNRTQDGDTLRASAESLQANIEDAFWITDEGYYALALDGRKQPVDSLASNPGHLLWCGVPSQSHAEAATERLMSPELFTGWGVRTMSNRMRGYNPISYHNGSVWPHDNSLIAAGMAAYGFAEEACAVANALIDASCHFPLARMPELFAGYDRTRTPFPVDYPDSCSPQAWAAGSIILMTQIMAGVTSTHDSLHVQPLPHGRRLALSGVRHHGRTLNLDCTPG
jgi:glycogen debranching enzyme